MLKRLKQKPLVEIAALFGGGFGLVLILGEMPLRNALKGVGFLMIKSADEIVENLHRLTLFNGLGFVLIGVSVTLILARLRYRLRTSPSSAGAKCPVCGGRLRRVHRNLFDRAINILLPVSRHKCRDPKCGWEGLRVKPLHDEGMGDPYEETDIPSPGNLTPWRSEGHPHRQYSEEAPGERDNYKATLASTSVSEEMD
ncbi:MAG TPA: hypothetical protein IGS52_06265 [Oscillatoriaceae cyanobacterium M33_DOE_052]|uniref:Uncharacterized protein n=1 Tax=Planktothricoides sp. SpSt-374 TaxID=2282167 RepID=A0A7C3ZWJ9_9CYAN|nr:hypothetical protein [Oscillatoriaceae cyanobacterium M33_DOE_052]